MILGSAVELGKHNAKAALLAVTSRRRVTHDFHPHQPIRKDLPDPKILPQTKPARPPFPDANHFGRSSIFFAAYPARRFLRLRIQSHAPQARIATAISGTPIAAKYSTELHPETPLLSPLYRSYTPSGITYPGSQLARYLPDVNGGNEGDMVAVSDSAHVTCHAR
jgi:hypothetical protein